MDPYDQPTCITDDDDCLRAWGTDRFSDEFYCELAKHEWKLPLETMCRQGGSPGSEDSAEFDRLKLDEPKDGKVTGSVTVSFVEVTAMGCSNMPTRTRRTGKLPFTLDLKTGEVEFERPTLERHYESDEF
jgi:hypothetical protein